MSVEILVYIIHCLTNNFIIITNCDQQLNELNLDD